MTKIDNIIVSWLDQRIADMLAVPQMWGSNEAVELQVLTLLEVRALTINPKRELGDPRRIFDSYVRLLHSKFPEKPASPLHHLALGDEIGFAETLSRLVTELSDSVSESTVFSRNPLGIEMRFKAGCPLSAFAVTHFYEEFRRSIRSLARIGDGSTGRVEKIIEEHTDFEFSEFTITPRNGTPAAACIGLRSTWTQTDFVARDKVNSALGQIADLAEWAEVGVSKGVPIEGGTELDARAIMQTLRILPARGVEETVIGGSLLKRETPIRLKAAYAQRLVSAMARDMDAEPFDLTASIRAIDLDRNVVSIGRKSKSRVQCYLPPELTGTITEVGVNARVVGKRYAPPTGSPFVLAETITLMPS